jgi:hypothetical protein
MRNQFVKALVATSLTVALAACGGGGGSSGGSAGSATSTLSFPIKATFATTTANGWSKNFTISGYCNGSGSRTTSAASTIATFEGASVLSSTVTITGNYTNCTPASFAQSSTAYFDNSYMPLGFNSVGVNYGVYGALNVPATGKVGDTGIIGTENLYTNSTKLVANGRVDVSYVIEAETSSTAILNFIVNGYNAAGTLTFTEQDRYRIGTSGALTPLTMDIQYASPTNQHYLWTYN